MKIKRDSATDSRAEAVFTVWCMEHARVWICLDRYGDMAVILWNIHLWHSWGVYWVLNYKGNKTSGMVLVILVNHFMYIPQTYLTFLNLRGFQEERPLPCLWQSSKDQWKYDGVVERNNCGWRERSEPLISSLQLKGKQTGWNGSDALSFPGDGQCGDLFSSSCCWLKLQCFSSA